MIKIIQILFLSFIITNCSPEHLQNLEENTTGSPEELPAKTDPSLPADENLVRFQNVVDTVLRPICWDCHKSFINYESVLTRVVAGEPEKSRLFIRARTDMPPWEDGYAPLTEEQLKVIIDWISQGALQ